jgi:hypothetical protein
MLSEAHVQGRHLRAITRPSIPNYLSQLVGQGFCNAIRLIENRYAMASWVTAQSRCLSTFAIPAAGSHNGCE